MEEKKKDLLKRLAGESGFNAYTLNFLNLLVDQNRIEALEEIVEAFEAKYCQLTDTQVATLRSAVKLEQEQQFLIAKKLQELTGSKNIKLKPVIDETLIAGFVVEYGSSQIDLSGAPPRARERGSEGWRWGWGVAVGLMLNWGRGGERGERRRRRSPEGRGRGTRWTESGACWSSASGSRSTAADVDPATPFASSLLFAVKGQLDKISGELYSTAKSM